jgi:DNA-binding SARP family transcriptional activator
VPREELAGAIWGDEPPRAWDSALSALLSKLRAALKSAGSDQIDISTGSGSHQLELGHEAWIDIESARSAIDEVEGLLRHGHQKVAWGAANVAVAIARRPFLPAEEGPWIETQRSNMRNVLMRGIDCLAAMSIQNGEVALAVQLAGEAVSLEPFREAGYRSLMRAHGAAGNRSEALRVFDHCRRFLAEELGVDPSEQTQAVYLELLGSS